MKVANLSRRGGGVSCSLDRSVGFAKGFSSAIVLPTWPTSP